MSGRIIWKFLLSSLLLVWAFANLHPLTETPFEDYILQRAVDDEEGLAKLLEMAQERVENGDAKTSYIALREIANEQRIDLQQRFFSDTLLSTSNLERKNASILRVLLRDSKPSLKPGLDLGGGSAFTLRISEESQNEFVAAERLTKAIEIMRKRIDGLGVAEPLIRSIPPDRLEVQLPGLNIDKDPEAVNALQKAARLDFRLVHLTERPGPDAVPGSYMTLPVDPQKPDGPKARFEVMLEEREDHQTGEINTFKHYVKQRPEFSGEVANAGAYLGPTGQYMIGLEFTDEGGKAFADVTQYLYDMDMRFGRPGFARQAIVLDGELYSVVGLSARDHGPIKGGRATITGNFTQYEAIELANVLNNPLEFDLVVDDMYTVSPQLAEDAQEESKLAATVGGVLVLIFMLGYYLVAGGVAAFSVLLNVLIILGALASFSATLTLPGVAAIVLTIGMAVDAQILIFERIREELRDGKSLQTALHSGFQKVFSTIVDANVTTLITACILIYFGEGPVKGFGVTLAIGIGASLFAAMVITRGLLEFLIEKEIVKTLLPTRLTGRFDFVPMAFRRPAFLCSWALVLLGVISVGVRWNEIFGIDFRGGAEVTLEMNQETTQDLESSLIEAVASQEDLGEVQAIFQTLIGEGERRLRLQMDEQQGRADQVVTAMQTAFPEADFEKVSESRIGAAVSDSIKRNAIISVLLALVGILLYVALRFEFGFGIGAVVATVHDVLMTIGVFVLLGGQFSAPMVAAILMIVGYTINDTIVVFDRIREELELRPEMNLFDIVNLAINRTLSRTLLTSVTTLMAAISLFIFGAGVIQDYSLIFVIGILTGTFSSIFIASPVFYWWHKGSRKHVEERELTRPSYDWEIGGKRQDSKASLPDPSQA